MVLRVANVIFDKITLLIEARRRSSHSAAPVFVIIDGPAGAGKSTLASQIVSHFGFGEIIHCDDLYNGWGDALTPTLERTIREWILEPIQESRPIRIRQFDWQRNSYGDEVVIPQSPLLILEGVGCAVESVRQLADLSIWIDIPFDLGLERVLARDGMEIHEEMLRWITQQAEFFALHRNRENCSLHLPYGAPAT